MSKFCTKCGRPLQEGEICSCQLHAEKQGGAIQSNQENRNQHIHRGPTIDQPGYAGGQPGSQDWPGQPGGAYPGGQPGSQDWQGQPGNPYPGGQPGSQDWQGQPGNPYPGGQPGKAFNSQQAAAYAQDFFKMIWNAVKSPVLAGRELVMKADLKASLLLVLLEGLLYTFYVSAALMSSIAKIRASLGGFSSMMPDMSVPFFRILVFFVIFSFANAAIFAGTMLVGHLAIKIPTSFKQMLSLSGLRSLNLLPGLAVAMVLSVINIYVGMVVFFLAVFWASIVVLVTMTSLVPQEKLNKFAAMLCICLLLSAVICLFFLGMVGSSFIPDVLDMPF